MAHRDPDQIHEEPSNSLLTNSRCCFSLPCFTSRRSSSSAASTVSWWERFRSSLHDDDHHQPWWSRGFRALKKIREWSEIVAGPKWKTFIRRFNRKNRGSGNCRHGKFQYDPLSYALNFDEGPGCYSGKLDEDDDYGGFRDFSSRYASVSGSGIPVERGAAGNMTA